MRDKIDAVKPPEQALPPIAEETLITEEKDLPVSVVEHSTVQVGGDAVETLIAEKRSGLRIRALRQKSSLGLAELGRHTGLSSSFLSQLETGRVVPTLRNLA